MSKLLSISSLVLTLRRKFLQLVVLVGLGMFLSVQSFGQCTTPVIAAKVVTTCSGVSFSVSPTDVLPDVVPAGTVYTWTAPTGYGASITGLADGTNAESFSGTLTNTTALPIDVVYIVTPSSFTCTGDPFTVTVTVNPTASVDSIDLTNCSGVIFAVTPTEGVIPNGVYYTWNTPGITASITGGESGVGTNITGLLTNTSAFVQTATYTVTPNLTNGCTSAPFTLAVAVFPVASINDVSLTVCSGANFNPTLIGTIPSGITYSWSSPTINGTLNGGVSEYNASAFSGTLTNTSGSVATATYFVTPNVAGGCTSAGFTVTVSVYPVANISSTSLTTCSGALFNLTPTGSPVPSETTYSWDVPSMDGVAAGV
ncbi:MAG: PKD-like domain-containing protein, partial [bacterium]